MKTVITVVIDPEVPSDIARAFNMKLKTPAAEDPDPAYSWQITMVETEHYSQLESLIDYFEKGVRDAQRAVEMRHPVKLEVKTTSSKSIENSVHMPVSTAADL